MKEVIQVPEYPLKVFEKVDPELLKLVKESSEFALADGVLPKRYKLLIAMALDAAHGAVGGVRALAREAMQAGASQEEIAETLRVAQYVGGVGSVYTAAHALREVL
jgi:alkylhydroperoxidase/carboxymuconolactone decarboxylase family protein YurZ